MKTQIMGLALLAGITSLCNTAVAEEVLAGRGDGDWTVKETLHYKITIHNNYVEDNSTEPALMKVVVKNTMERKSLRHGVLIISNVTGTNSNGHAEFVKITRDGWKKIPVLERKWELGDIPPGKTWTINLHVLTFPFDDFRAISRHLQRDSAQLNAPSYYSYRINPSLQAQVVIGSPENFIYSCYTQNEKDEQEQCQRTYSHGN